MRDLPRGQRIRLALQELGPIFVKFGQILSTRRDLVPPDVSEELTLLQDRVAPFPGEEARAIVEAALAQPVEVAFASFDTTPLASASIAQVHAATLPAGDGARPREVVVKVLRPGIKRRIAEDVALHDWLLSTVLEIVGKSALGVIERQAALQRLLPAIDYLLHLWMPGARGATP